MKIKNEEQRNKKGKYRTINTAVFSRSLYFISILAH